MTGWSKPNLSFTGASSAALQRCSRPFCRFRMAVARSPGTSICEKNVTEAAATRTSTAERNFPTMVIAASLDEVRVGEDRLALALLDPDVLQAVVDGHRRGLGVETDARRVVRDE